MQIFIKARDSLSFTLNADPWDTIEDIKSKIQQKIGVSKDQQCLVYHNRTTVNWLKLQDYSVENNSTFNLIYTGDVNQNLFPHYERLFPRKTNIKKISHRNTNLEEPSSRNKDIILTEMDATVVEYNGKINGVLRSTLQWNDIKNKYDENDLDLISNLPNGSKINYSNKFDSTTGGELDVDITHPQKGIPACENITFPEKERMIDGTYEFLVNQYAYRNGKTGFRVQISFDNKNYLYDYRSVLPDGETVKVAEVTLKNGEFSINHFLQCR